MPLCKPTEWPMPTVKNKSAIFKAISVHLINVKSINRIRKSMVYNQRVFLHENLIFPKGVFRFLFIISGFYR